MAVQFSLSYDDNGDPVLTENTVSGVRKVVSYAPVVSKYKPRFTSIEKEESDDVTMLSGAMEKKEVNENRLDSFINEMENNAAEDTNLSFIQKQDLERYTPTAIQKAATGSVEMAKMIISALADVPVSVGGIVVKALDAILPDEDPEVKAMKQYYASDETSQLVESIPGMANYNLVSGFGDSLNVGYARAAQKRIDRINKTLLTKDSEVLRQRKKDLEKLIDEEDKARKKIADTDFAKENANPVVNLTPQQKNYFRNGGNQGGNQDGNQGNNNQGGGADYSSAGETGAKAGFGYGL